MAPPTETQANGKRKPGRRDPERRRQQNLRAQKKYREKVKEHLARLEALHSREMQGPGVTDAANRSPDLHRSAAAGLVPVEDGPAASASGPSGVGVPDEDKAPELDVWDPTVHFDPFLVHRLRSHDTTAAAAGVPVCTTAPLACNCGHTHATLVQTHTPHDGAPGSPPPARVVHLGGRRPGAGADPYANHLRVEVWCTIAALQAAGAPLGVAPERMCARDGTASPFARPLGAATGPAAMRVAARLFASLPRDLRPDAVQIVCPHPPVIDALPFPTLRRNLVVVAVAGGGWCPAFEAFFVDVLVGLVCRADGGGEAPGPWEARAWEARPWFLCKYWALLGGETGELVRQSTWWRTARGELGGLVGA